jgi:phage host-nuclease inhibitor protein Gam
VSTTRTKIKAKAADYTPQSKDDCAAGIRKLGELQRTLARATADMNDQIAQITHAAQPGLDELKLQITSLQEGVQRWCEANRHTLTEGGKVKTANLVTGEVSWRTRPPSCAVRGADSVIETLRRMGFSEFIRTRDEINKEAILNEPEKVRGIAGISIVTGVEDFAITPFEQEAA